MTPISQSIVTQGLNLNRLQINSYKKGWAGRLRNHYKTIVSYSSLAGTAWNYKCSAKCDNIILFLFPFSASDNNRYSWSWKTHQWRVSAGLDSFIQNGLCQPIGRASLIFLFVVSYSIACRCCALCVINSNHATVEFQNISNNDSEITFGLKWVSGSLVKLNIARVKLCRSHPK